MDLKGLSLFSALNRKMNWLGKRQGLLADNIANANTPGHRARDITPLSFAQVMTEQSGTRSKVMTTHPAHVTGAHETRATRTRQGRVYDVKSMETKRDGNSVVLEQEQAKLAETQMEYTATVNIYRKHVAMLRTALGRSG
ncbi:MAG: flagellar basal body rod protein FlgB [Sphingomonadales bacterium]